MAKLEFENIKNKEKGKIGVVCGHSSSLQQRLELFEKLSREEKDKFCFICCSEYSTMTNINADYCVIANSAFTVEKNWERFNNQGSILVYADSVDTTDRNFVENHLKIDYVSYDERHIASGLCVRKNKCCDNIIPGRKTIMEYLQSITGHDKMYNSCGTVGIHMIALGVILGCNPLYVDGIDMDYSKGYVNGHSCANNNILGQYRQEFSDSAKIISDSAEKIGIEIININKSATYDGLKKGEFNYE